MWKHRRRLVSEWQCGSRRVSQFFEGHLIVAVRRLGGVGNVPRVGTDQAVFGFCHARLPKAGIGGSTPYGESCRSSRAVCSLMLRGVHIILGKEVAIGTYEDMKEK